MKVAGALGGLAAVLMLIGGSALMAQGPPFQTDDPVPVDHHHYEFYIFGSVDGTPVEIDAAVPAFEFNWGAIPRVQLHAILPWGVAAPLNNPVYFPAGTGPHSVRSHRYGTWRQGRVHQGTPRVPQIGSFTMVEVPTGNYEKGLGVGKVWYKLPLWMQKNVGHWTLRWRWQATRSCHRLGFATSRTVAFFSSMGSVKRFELGGEVFSHAREGPAAPQTQASTMIDAGGYYHLKHHPGEQFLFCYGHSVAGQTENYAYVGWYWTWGKDDKKTSAPSPFRSAQIDAGN